MGSRRVRKLNMGIMTGWQLKHRVLGILLSEPKGTKTSRTFHIQYICMPVTKAPTIFIFFFFFPVVLVNPGPYTSIPLLSYSLSPVHYFWNVFRWTERMSSIFLCPVTNSAPTPSKSVSPHTSQCTKWDWKYADDSFRVEQGTSTILLQLRVCGLLRIPACWNTELGGRQKLRSTGLCWLKGEKVLHKISAKPKETRHFYKFRKRLYFGRKRWQQPRSEQFCSDVNRSRV